jgi:oligosaccharide repeat unit polymerase
LKIYVLIFMLLLVLFMAYKAMDKDLMSPAFLYTAPFCIALLCGAVYADKWSLDLHFNTFMTILVGAFLFVLVCTIVHFSYGKRLLRISKRKDNQCIPINVESWKIGLIIIIQCISLYVVIGSMRASLAKYGISGNLALIMYYFRSYSLFSEYSVGISGLAINLRLFSIASCYIWVYVFVNNRILKRKTKNEILLIISFGLGIANSVILGARGEALQLIFAVVAVWFFIKRKYNNWKANIKFKQIIALMAGLLFMLAIFKSTGDLLGRSSVIASTTSAIDEVAKYLGAEIKNLDLFLNEKHSKSIVFGEQTFSVLLAWIDARYGMGWNIDSILTFRRINGISLGNVYTLYAPLVYDFGYVGAMIMIVAMAVLSQCLYENVLIVKKRKAINGKIILNSYMLFLLAFSFFGERVFSSILNFSFYKYILIWLFMIWFATKVHFKVKDINRK